MSTRRGWALGLVLVSCRGTPASAPEEQPRAVAGTKADDASLRDRDAPDSVPEGGAPSSAAAPVSTGGDAAGQSFEDCGAQRVTLEQIHAGRVRAGVRVSVGPIVASSQKFLASEAKSGSCLWGAFAADPEKRGPGSGLLLVSFGAQREGGESCRADTDGIPDDLAPGDVLELEGKVDEYAPASCDGVARSLEFAIDPACGARRMQRVAPPEPYDVDVALAERLAAGKDAELLRSYSGALLRLHEVSAIRDEADGDAVFSFGVVRLAETALEVSSRLYYFDLSQGGPKAAVKTPRFAYPTTFRSVTGALFLDYCSWSLAPRDRCSDFDPASAGCSGSAERP
jgi:hypothetical protein